MTTKLKKATKMMAFYHQDGFTAAWNQATAYLGKDNGRIATLPDIVDARLASVPGDIAWERYYTTLSAEYVGIGKDGKKLLIVAHGIGPMSTLEGIQKAYSWQYKDKSRRRDGGRISSEEFLKLEAGEYGPVAIVDLMEYIDDYYKYPFSQLIRERSAQIDPVLKARLGDRSTEYIGRLAKNACAWHGEQMQISPENRFNLPQSDHQNYLDRRQKMHQRFADPDSAPFIIEVKDGSCSYRYHELEEGYAFAHLLSVGGLCHVHHEGYESLSHDISCHGWTDGVRLVAIPKGSELALYNGPDPYQLLIHHWPELMQPMTPPAVIGMRRIFDFAGRKFTQYPKAGASLDTGEAEYLVASSRPIGVPNIFRTEVGGYHGFFKYDLKEIQAIAPPQANAYAFIKEPEIEWNDGNPTHHRCVVQFYEIKADTSKRLMRAQDLARDLELMMELLEKEKKS